MSKYLPTFNNNEIGSDKKNVIKNLVKSNHILTSDHLAKVNILHEYVKSSNKNVFCKQNLINKNNIKRAVLVRNQLEDYLKQIIKNREQKNFVNIPYANKTSIQDSVIDGNSVRNWMKCMEKASLYNSAKLGK